jgi:cobalt/nickel transport system permease protein
MAVGHAHALVVEADSPLHRLAPQAKLVATFGFVLAVVAAPREAFWAYAVFAGILVALACVGHVPLRLVLRRMVVEVPFLLFAFALPFIGGDPHTDVLGLSLSVPGLWGMWNIVVKASLGLFATLLLTATTPLTELLHGFDRLRVPRAFTAIAGFMVRYADVVAADMRRMQVARVSRAHDPRWIWHARAVASSAGALFIRTYERGERVHLAMLSRGYDGTLPPTRAVAREQWGPAVALPIVAALITLTAWGLR